MPVLDNEKHYWVGADELEKLLKRGEGWLGSHPERELIVGRYLLPGNLERLRSRNVGGKRSLAARAFALGVEALEWFVRKEPLRLTHQCVFGVLALESESIDPRLWRPRCFVTAAHVGYPQDRASCSFFRKETR